MDDRIGRLSLALFPMIPHPMCVLPERPDLPTILAGLEEIGQEFKGIAFVFQGLLPIRVVFITGSQAPVQMNQGCGQPRSDEIKQKLEFQV